MINGRYAVSVTTKYGMPGDYIDIHFIGEKMLMLEAKQHADIELPI